MKDCGHLRVEFKESWERKPCGVALLSETKNLTDYSEVGYAAADGYKQLTLGLSSVNNVPAELSASPRLAHKKKRSTHTVI